MSDRRRPAPPVQATTWHSVLSSEDENASGAAGTAAERPSKTALKAQAHELQTLGRKLSELSNEQLSGIPMDDALRDALQTLRRTRSHEGRRRQLQLVGKLMRQVDADPLREAVAALQLGPAREALHLHRAEYWRDAMVSDETAITRFVADHPDVEIQALRQLVRRARSESQADPGLPGAAPRRGPAWRALFKFIRPVVESAPTP